MYKLALGEHAIIELIKKDPLLINKVIVKNKSEAAKYQHCDVKIEINSKAFNKIKEDIYALAYFIPYTSKLDKDSTHLLLHNIKDEGELGTIIRTAVAFDIRNIVLINSSVDIFSLKSIRASTGAVFMANIVNYKNKDEYLKIYKNKYYEFKDEGALLSLNIARKLAKNIIVNK